MSDAPHIPVLLDEVIDALAPAPGALMIDGTFGAGGYSAALLARGARVIAFDRDPRVRAFARPLAAANEGRLTLVEDRFSAIGDTVETASAQGVTFDVGVSSMQLDEAERGFSFMRDGPLDMRMGVDGPTAADLVNESEPAELSRLFWLYGEERQSRRIAAALARRRAEQPFTRTLDLAEAVERAVGRRRGAPTHPATKVFQALRIAVNAELDELTAGLAAAERVLAPGGRLAVVTFHSLEDRIVKGFLTERAGRTPGGSRHLPVAPAGPPPTFDLLWNGVRAPSDAEIARNPRARSAKLRAAARTLAPARIAA